MRIVFRVLTVAVLITVQPAGAADPIIDFLSSHCFGCHSDGDASDGGLDLASTSYNLADEKTFSRWVTVFDRVQAGEMPPRSEARPQLAEVSPFLKRLKLRLVQHDQSKLKHSGRTVLRRLNRDEYERTVQDLLGITSPLAPLLPAETPLHGFDTVATGLRFSALHLEHYLAAANVALDEAIDLSEDPAWVDERFDYTEQEGILKNIKDDKTIVRLIDDAAVIFSDAAYINRLHGLNIDRAGLYRVRMRAKGFQTQRPLTVSLHAGNWNKASTRVLTFDDIPAGEYAEVETIARIERNEYVYPAPKGLKIDPQGHGVWHYGGESYEHEGIAIEWIEVEGPLVDSWPPASVQRVIGSVPVKPLEQKRWQAPKTIAYEMVPEDPRSSLEKILIRFAERAFRRPATDISIFLDIATSSLDQGESFDTALRLGLRSILTSPRFLTLNEKPGKLDDHALACRLSYFLTSTMPDDELRELANAGRLSNPEILRAQTERLLEDPRSDAFVRRFTDQWLDLQRIDATSPDKLLYPEFTELLQLSMLDETRSFFREILREDLSVLNFIDSDFTMLNGTLAAHYGIDDVAGQAMQRTSLPADSLRGGVMTQASVLKVTANGTVTSPVSRGAFVLARLLNDPPSPPPPGVGSIEPDTRGATTVREQLAKHRDVEACARCHESIDPPGFALENFDVIGGYRTRYRSTDKGEYIRDRKLFGRSIWEYKDGLPVEAGGVTADGFDLKDVNDFKKWMLQKPDKVASAVASQLITYGTGAPVGFGDREMLAEIVERSRESNFGLNTMIHEIIQSRLFQYK